MADKKRKQAVYTLLVEVGRKAGDGLPADSSGEADRIMAQLREIEGLLTRWMGTPEHPMMWDPPGLIDRRFIANLPGRVHCLPLRKCERIILEQRFKLFPR